MESVLPTLFIDWLREDRNRYLSRICELGGIGEKIDQNLSQPSIISDYDLRGSISDGLAQLQDTIARVREGLNRPELRVLGILPTLYDHTKVAREVLRTLRDHFPEQVFETLIPKNVQVEEVYGRQGSLYDYAPRSKGALAYQAFVKEVIDHAQREHARSRAGCLLCHPDP